MNCAVCNNKLGQNNRFCSHKCQGAYYRKHGSPTTKHGMSYTPEYKTWESMLKRCRNPKAKDYERYGGRGVKVCKRWHKFENFFEDMGKKPDNQSIERIDNSKGYEPTNCKWATVSEQTRNKRNNIVLEYKGETKLLLEWSELLGIPAERIRNRLRKPGWDVERALSTSYKPRW